MEDNDRYIRAEHYKDRYRLKDYVTCQLDGRFMARVEPGVFRSVQPAEGPTVYETMLLEYLHFRDHKQWRNEAKTLAGGTSASDTAQPAEQLFFSLQLRIWELDDAGTSQKARKYRKVALDALDHLIREKESERELFELYSLIKLDLMRRAGMFFRAKSICRRTVFVDETIKKCAAYEMSLLRRFDSKAHTWGDILK